MRPWSFASVSARAGFICASVASSAKRRWASAGRRGWLPLSARQSSPPWAWTCAAMAWWQPMASMVTTAPWRSRRRRHAGTAAIGLLLSFPAPWPGTRLNSPVAKARTTCSARPPGPSKRRRSVLPSMATCQLAKLVNASLFRCVRPGRPWLLHRRDIIRRCEPISDVVFQPAQCVFRNVKLHVTRELVFSHSLTDARAEPGGNKSTG